MTKDSTAFTTILDALNLKELPVEAQEQMLLELNDLVYKGTMTRLIEQMNEKTRNAFLKLLDENVSEVELGAFIEKHAPHVDDAVRDTLNELTNDILMVTK
jgi:succinate dehydrogenase flavin-adding protein (antitoxin of CptAB toxin-antitoxin module)